MQGYMARKGAYGLSFTNKKNTFVFFTGFGIKGFKIDIGHWKFSNEFLSDIETNYIADSTSEIGGLIAQSIYDVTQDPDKFYTRGKYSNYLHFGIIFPKIAIRPSIDFYWGNNHFTFYNSRLYGYNDNPDYYATMRAQFKEIKIGFTPPLKFWANRNFAINLHVGYKWINYREISLSGVSLSHYTSGNLVNNYGKAGKLTYSVSLKIWKN